MKALIFENKVVDVQETEFEVAPTMTWVDCDDTVKLTEVCLYNSSNQLMAIGNLTVPLTKESSNYALLKTSITMDGGVKDSPCDDGRVTYPLSN